MGSFLLTIPLQVDTHEAREAHEGVAHESNTAALGGGTEEGNAGLLGLQLISVLCKSGPCRLRARLAVVLQSVDVGSEASIGLDEAPEADLEQGH